MFLYAICSTTAGVYILIEDTIREQVRNNNKTEGTPKIIKLKFSFNHHRSFTFLRIPILLFQHFEHFYSHCTINKLPLLLPSRTFINYQHNPEKKERQIRAAKTAKQSKWKFNGKDTRAQREKDKEKSKQANGKVKVLPVLCPF